MAHYLALEDYKAPRKMREIWDNSLKDENIVPKNTANIRLSQWVEIGLKVAVLAAEKLKKEGLTTLDKRNPATLSIKERAKFFEENTPAKLAQRQGVLNAKVIHWRKWLSRQGATFRGRYDIDHGKLKNKLVKYDNDLARQGATKVIIKGGKFYYASNNQPLDTTKMVTHHSGPGYAIYVLSGQGNFHVASHKVGQYHHSSLLAGGEVACAGEMVVHNGVLKLLSNKSGHYKPDNDDLLHALSIIQDNGSNMMFKVYSLSANWAVEKFDSVEAFLADNLLDNATVQKERDGVDDMVGMYGGYVGASLTDSYGNIIAAETDNYGNPIL